MIIDSKGKLFEERRKKDRRKNEFGAKEEKRSKPDRRNQNNEHKSEE